MATLARMTVKLVADIAGFSSEMEKAQMSAVRAAEKTGKVWKEVGGNLNNAGQTLTAGVTLPLLGAGAASVLFANTFNAGMANVASLGAEAADAVGEWKPMVQDIAIATAKSTDDMTTGLYNVVSAFGVAEDTLQVLDINARAATAGLATTEDAINLTSAVTKVYGDTSAVAVQQVSDLALTAVQLGQTTFPDLAASVGSVTPLMRELGGTQQELFATMATATGVTGNASAVSTQLRGVLQSLMAPTKDMSALIAASGYESGQAMLQNLGLAGTLDAIVQSASSTNTPLQSYIGSIEGQTLALALTGSLQEKYVKNLEAMQNASGATDAAFAAQTEGVNKIGFAMEQAKVQGQVWAQQIGDQLMPLLVDLMIRAQPIVDWISRMISGFASLDAKTQGIILAALGFAVVLGPLLMIVGQVAMGIGAIIPIVTAVSGAISAALPVIATVVAAISGPVLLVIGLVVAAIALLAVAWANNWFDIQGKTQAAIDFVRNLIAAGMQFISDLTSGKLGWISEYWENVTSAIMLVVNTWATNIKLIFQAFQAAMNGDWRKFGELLREAWDNTWNMLGQIVKLGWENIKLLFVNMIDAIVSFFTDTDWGAVGKAIVDGIARGLSNGAKAIGDAAKAAANAALEAAKGFLGIQSPSKLFEQEIGFQMAAGVAIGWTGGLNRLMPAAMPAVMNAAGGKVAFDKPQAGRPSSNGNGMVVNIMLQADGDEYETAHRLAKAIKVVLRQEGLS